MERDFLALGITHYPPLAGTDKDMAAILRWTLTDPDIPPDRKDPDNWPERMRREWGDDQGVSSAAEHRAALVQQLTRAREELDRFRPDVVIVWGDDQYENFREEVVPQFCVLAYDKVRTKAFEIVNAMGSRNFWGLPDDLTIEMPCDLREARRLTDALGEAGVDIAYSYRKRDGGRFPHAILNTQLFLDYAHAGREMSYPIVPITVNCYGQHAIARKGGLARFADIRDEELDPAGPSPRRCFELGQRVARSYVDKGLRVAFVASSSWSHAFLHDREWHLFPDTASDERLYEALLDDDFDVWRSRTTAEVVAAGQHEILNWHCMLGAVHELGLNRAWSEFVPSDVFNSNKCFAAYN